MNQRIQQLAERACFKNQDEESITYFAQLIVQECAKRIDYWESRQGEHCDDLLKHFGVEEHENH